MTDNLKKDEKLVFESGEEVVKADAAATNVTDDDRDVPMSNGEACGIVEFEGKRINTCKGEKIVESGYSNPDRNDR